MQQATTHIKTCTLLDNVYCIYVKCNSACKYFIKTVNSYIAQKHPEIANNVISYYKYRIRKRKSKLLRCMSYEA